MPRTTPYIWRSLALEFWAGFSTPSRLAAGVMALSFAATLSFAAWFFSPSAMVGNMGDYLPRSARDAEGFATIQAVRLGANGIDRPTFIALGSSTIAQSLDDGRYLLADLAGRTGQTWDFVSLTTPQQSPFDQMALLETVLAGHTADAPPMIILLSASGQRLTWTVDRMIDDDFQDRVGLRSTWVADELTRLGQNPRWQSGIYAIDNFSFVCLNGTEALLRLALDMPARQRIAAYSNGQTRSGSDRAMPLLRDRFLAGQSNIDTYLDMQRRLITQLQSYDNVHVVLIDEPYAPDALIDLDLIDLHRESAQLFMRFADETGTDYWPFIAQADLTADDYHDAFHLTNGTAQERAQRSLSRIAAEYIMRMDL